MTLLEVDGLTKSFGGVTAIADLAFEVSQGQVYSVIGPNGAGKTTLFNMLSGIYRPDEGRVRFQGHELVGRLPHQIARLGLSRTFQNLQLFFNMTTLDNVMVGCHLRTRSGLVSAALRLRQVIREEKQSRQWALESMTFCGLEAYVTQQAGALPYGVLKRLEIARALALQPKLLLMDAAHLQEEDARYFNRKGLVDETGQRKALAAMKACRTSASASTSYAWSRRPTAAPSTPATCPTPPASNCGMVSRQYQNMSGAARLDAQPIPGIRGAWRSSTSTPAEGSSRKSTRGSWLSALAISTRRFIPPDSAMILLSRLSHSDKLRSTFSR